MINQIINRVLQMLIRAIKNINKKLEKSTKDLAISMRYFFFFPKKELLQTTLKNSLDVTQNGINKTVIYVIKTRLDIASLLKVGFPGDTDCKESACQCRRPRFHSLGQKDPLEKRMVTHSSILAWRNPRREKPGRLQPMGSQRIGYD